LDEHGEGSQFYDGPDDDVEVTVSLVPYVRRAMEGRRFKVAEEEALETLLVALAFTRHNDFGLLVVIRLENEEEDDVDESYKASANPQTCNKR